MLHSMTGFGKSEAELSNISYTIDVKSVNSKTADVNIRIPSHMRAYELEVRKIVVAKLQRGKIDVYINATKGVEESNLSLNVALIQNYINQMENVSSLLTLDKKFETAMRMPNVTSELSKDWGDAEWLEFQKALKIALDNLIQFRKDEGSTLQTEFEERIANIQELLTKVPQYENDRIITIKDRMIKMLEDIKEVDKERLEQELIFYTEKLDITEEKVRLQKHIEYFLETMHLPESNGKKLNFILQEMGREINTLGSKSNHAELQKIVVEMKDELEKIKEQILNIL